MPPSPNPTRFLLTLHTTTPGLRSAPATRIDVGRESAPTLDAAKDIADAGLAAAHETVTGTHFAIGPWQPNEDGTDLSRTIHFGDPSNPTTFTQTITAWTRTRVTD